MKGRVIVIDMPDDRASQAALIIDGRIEDLLIDPPRGDTTPKPGEIYWAKVDRLVPKIGGAFVKLTPDHQGYLRETKGVKQGQSLLVQGSSYAEPDKATPVTTRLLHKGKYVILTPGAPGINVSRRIRHPDERDRLAAIAEQIMGTEPGEGLILRSAADGISAEALQQDLALVLERAESEPPITFSARQLAEADWDGQIETAADGFDHYGVWDEIERLKSPRTDLPSGGWMAVEATRAMVTVDVNTGDGFGQGDAMTANIEAARELPRQLRLRGLGGQIILDFAPMKKMHRRKIEEELKRTFARDSIQTTLAGWTPLGNFELTRKRERRPLSELLPD